MRRFTYAIRLITEQQTTISHHKSNSSGKQRRSGTGVSFLVFGSQICKRAASESLAVLDEQEERTTVKRKQRGKRQTRGQSKKLTGNKPAKEKPGPVS